MKVLFVASEAVPFVKTGGLADVVGSLPKYLLKAGVDARVVIPKYSQIPNKFQEKMTHVACGELNVYGRRQQFNIKKLIHEGITVYFIENAYFFERPGELYGHFDDAERFSFFSRAALILLDLVDFLPDVIHSHDWHTALTGVYLRAHYQEYGLYSNMKSVFTIHNLKYQGIFDKTVFFELLDLDWRYFRQQGLEYYDRVNFLKGGILFADMITTVSQTYAQEIQTPEYGETLDGLLRRRSDRLIGIINGIDYNIYNPNKDPALLYKYNAKNALKQKVLNKASLRKTIGLDMPIRQNMDYVPLASMVSRLTNSKGFDILLNILDELLYKENMQLVILGTGDQDLSHKLLEIQHRHQNKLAVFVRFDEQLARQIYAASDIFIMPSLYEPCGLSQMIAMRYGALPIVRETGGLLDTVQPFNKHTCQGNGFTFFQYADWDLLATVRRALDVYNKERDIWEILVQNAMNCDYSWNNSALKYQEMYEKLFV